MPALSSRQRGTEAEQLAERWLRRQGLTTLARNWQCRHGELDLVMHQGRTVVFVEVRQRASNAFGGAVASVTRAKQRRLGMAASAFLASRPALAERDCRFDVLAINGHGRTAEMQWIQNAFLGEH
ncbi:MAG: YraN family protein [Alcanivoracaceae bacterium]|jgi:putative endonuclease|nr:YraN family protein [Alcanivoracaceae bacterium]